MLPIRWKIVPGSRGICCIAGHGDGPGYITDVNSIIGMFQPKEQIDLDKLAVHEIKLRLGTTSESGVRIVHVRLDKNVVSANYLYVVQDRMRRRVKFDLDKSLRTCPLARYRVRIENNYGEFTDCVFTDQEMKQVLLPVPLPGGVAINYT